MSAKLKVNLYRTPLSWLRLSAVGIPIRTPQWDLEHMETGEVVFFTQTLGAAFIGFAGVVVGIVIAEFFRRGNRVEFYSQRLFERRLEAHEHLLSLVSTASTVAGEVMTDIALSKEDRHALMSSAIHGIAEFVDDKQMLIDPLVGAHATAFLMGVEDVPEIADPIDREAAASEFWKAIRETKSMIRQEAGAEQISKHFRSVARSRPSSPIIERIKELQKDYPASRE